MRNIKNKKLKFITVCSLLFGSLGVQAQIVYQVDRNVGAGTIKGVIETDGTLGSLTPANILSWSLVADDGSGHEPITIGGSFPEEGLTGDGNGWSFLIATESELVFDFDGALDSGSFAGVQFYGDGGFADVSVNYGLSAGSDYGKKENLVHFFPEGSHYVESFREGVVVVGTTNAPVAYCSGPKVGMGEVMAGLQAGLTGGAHTVDGQPEAFFGAVNFEDRRGFIVPENEISSVQCDNDHILLGEYFATPVARFDKIQDARDFVGSLFDGRFVEYYFEIDGYRVDHIQTATKIGFLPGGTRVAFFNAGYVIEPYSLSPGPHAATFVLVRDPGSDGEPPFVDIRFPAYFTIVESAPAAQ
jgi:hypothetical protein